MLIERPPILYRLLYRRALWRAKRRYKGHRPVVYLTFDDGPTPEATPGVLDILKRYDIKAVFFMVADNARRYPTLMHRVASEGHIIANHTTHHLKGLFTSCKDFIADVDMAESILGKTTMFRPPHGFIRRNQYKTLGYRFRVVMEDVVTRDYSRLMSPREVTHNVLKNARPGSVICFHDSEKSAFNVLNSLENAIIGLQSAGFVFDLLTPDD